MHLQKLGGQVAHVLLALKVKVVRFAMAKKQ